MARTIDVLPDSLRTGAPITARVTQTVGTESPPAIKVLPRGQAGVEAFDVPLRRDGDQLEGQFILSFPGRYELQLGDLRRTIEVDAQRDLSFQQEFGLFSVVVIILVGGMLLWLRRKKSTAGSVSGSGHF